MIIQLNDQRTLVITEEVNNFNFLIKFFLLDPFSKNYLKELDLKEVESLCDNIKSYNEKIFLLRNIKFMRDLV